MSIKPGDAISIQFTTQNPSTGAAQNADVLPTGVLVRNGADTAVVVTIANVDTGVYSASATLPSTYTNDDIVEIRIQATVNAVDGEAVVWSEPVLNVSALVERGATEVTYTVTDSVSGDPIFEADVWTSVDVAGTDVRWRGQSDAFGVARDAANNKPWLDSGTWYFFTQKTAYSFTNPDIEVVP